MLKKSIRLISYPFMHILHRIECRALSGIKKQPDLIFIVGAPRSGTTLTYQMLISAFNLGYISNRIAPFYQAISFAERSLRTGKKTNAIDFESDHGRTKESLGPHECGNFWYQYFPKTPHHVGANDMTVSKKTALFNSVYRIHQAFGKPIIFKNVINSARLQVLKEVFPSAIFIEVEREIVSNAYSIMVAKKKALGTDDACWSLRPNGYESYLNSSPAEQAYQQVLLTQNMIRKDRPLNHIKVRYEALCSNPRDELERIRKEAERHGLDLTPRTPNNIPKSFNMSHFANRPDLRFKNLTRVHDQYTREQEKRASESR